MGQRPFIVIGDQTDHGGVVVGAAGTTDTHGKRIARVGDQVTCPKKGHGTTVIVTGDPTMIIDGQTAARHGDKCACGATLIAAQFVSTTSDGSASDPQASSEAQKAKVAAVGVFSRYSDHDEDEIIEQFYSLLDDEGNPVEGYRYDLYENGSMKVQSGDFSAGQTQPVHGDSNINIVYWLNKSGTTKS